jgi:hypothetical protein
MKVIKHGLLEMKIFGMSIKGHYSEPTSERSRIMLECYSWTFCRNTVN